MKTWNLLFLRYIRETKANFSVPIVIVTTIKEELEKWPKLPQAQILFHTFLYP